MNKEDAHLYLPLVQALVDGKTLQAKDIQGKWFDLDDIALGGGSEHYRIKPEPRKWKIWVDSHGYLQSSGDFVTIPTGWTQIEVTEILPKNKQ